MKAAAMAKRRASAAAAARAAEEAVRGTRGAERNASGSSSVNTAMLMQQPEFLLPEPPALRPRTLLGAVKKAPAPRPAPASQSPGHEESKLSGPGGLTAEQLRRARKAYDQMLQACVLVDARVLLSLTQPRAAGPQVRHLPLRCARRILAAVLPLLLQRLPQEHGGQSTGGRTSLRVPAVQEALQSPQSSGGPGHPLVGGEVPAAASHQQ